MAKQKLVGSCLCSRVKFSVDADMQHFYFCHCLQCQKTSGSAHVANILAKPTDIEWLSGSEFVKRFDHPSGRSFTRVFCSECGCGLPYINVEATTLFIPAGCLDNDPGIQPEKNIFWTEKASWYEAGKEASTCPGFP